MLSFVALVAMTPAALQTVEVPFRLGENAMIVDATVNSRKVSLMFDTGYGGAVVLDSTIDIGKPSGKQILRDFVGEFEAPTVKIKSLSIGTKAVPVKDVDAVMQPGGQYSLAYGTHCDGIMGFEAIKDTITEINFQQKKFIFHPNSLDITKRTPDNQKTFLAKLLPIGHNSMEMEVVVPGGKKMTLALDTGNAFYATTHKDVLERVGLWSAGKEPKYTRLSGVASGTVDSWSFLMPEATIFGVPVKETVWDIIDLPSSSADGDGTIGFGFLSNFNITIDYARRRVWLERFSDKVENVAPGDLGISASYDDRARRVVIHRVSPESPAAAAGIKVGDHILSLDGEDLEAIGFRKLYRMLQGPVDSTVKLALSRGGNLKRYQLKRVPLYNQPG